MAKKSLVKRCKLPYIKQKQLLNFFYLGSTSRTCARVLKIQKNSVLLFFRKIRAEIQKRQAGALSGVVEVDETYLSAGKSRAGRCLQNKIAVVGAVERGTRRARLCRVPDASRKTLQAFCICAITKGAQVHTDHFRSYNKLGARGFEHKRVNHFLQYKDFKTGACTNLIESLWAYLKRHFARLCGGYRHRLSLWLAEIEMRFECGARFYDELKKLLTTKKKTAIFSGL